MHILATMDPITNLFNKPQQALDGAVTEKHLAYTILKW